MIDWLVFSKDRPLQLDALLTSIERHHLTMRSFTVLHRGTSSMAQTDHPWATWWPDDPDWRPFQTQVDEWLRHAGPRIGFLTDDSIFTRHPAPPSVIPHAYRIGFNTTRCETLGIDQQPPTSKVYEWRGMDGDFGYPLSLDGTVYMRDTITELLDFTFSNPTELEAGLAARADRFRSPVISMDDHSSLLGFAHTRVSSSSGCPYSGLYSTEQLTELYRQGKRIRPERMQLDRIDCASTQTIPYVIE